MEIETIIGLIINLILLVFVFVHVFRKRDRRKKLRKAAREVYCTFSEKQPTDSLPPFDLFSQGHSRDIQNVLHKTIGDVNITICDYHFMIKGGRGSRAYKQTVFWARFSVLTAPSFTLHPESRLHGVAELFGTQDIDFETHPTFSKRFVLQGEESALRQFFSPLLLAYYEEHDQNFSTEMRGKEFILYRESTLVPPDQIEGFLEDGRELIELCTLGMKSREEVLSALQNEQVQVRAMAARAAGLFRDPTVISVLLPLLTDPHEQVRQGVVWTLGLLHVAHVMPYILTALDDSSENVRHEAETTLRKICPLVQTVVFGDISPEHIEHTPQTVCNPDVSKLSTPMNALNQLIIDVSTHDFYQVERFLTYAVNALGQKHLKQHLVVQVIGEQQNLHVNLRNSLTHLCKHVQIFAQPDINTVFDTISSISLNREL